METPRQLTASEIALLLTRHPLEADYIIKTRIALATGTYDFTQTLPSWFFGLIPPWGTQFEDSTYGTVTIYFGADHTLYVAGYSPILADVNKDPYTAPPHKCKDGSDLSIVGTCPEDFNILYWIIGAAILAGVVFLAIEFEVFKGKK